MEEGRRVGGAVWCKIINSGYIVYETQHNFLNADQHIVCTHIHVVRYTIALEDKYLRVLLLHS